MDLTIYLVFLAGILTFLSPCVLPIIPGFVGYLMSLSNSRKSFFLNTVFYVLGFTITFSLLGLLLSTIFKGSAFTYQSILSRIGGLIIIFFGLYTLGLFKIPMLEKNFNLDIKLKNSYLTSFLFGFSFAVGWSPCIGAVLGGVYTLALTNPQSGFYYMLAYSLGLGVPFLLVGLLGDKSYKFFNKFKPAVKYFNLIAGLLLITIGMLMLFQKLYLISNFTLIDFMYS